MALLDLKITVSKNGKNSSEKATLQALNEAKMFEVALKSMDRSVENNQQGNNLTKKEIK